MTVTLPFVVIAITDCHLLLWLRWRCSKRKLSWEQVWFRSWSIRRRWLKTKEILWSSLVVSVQC